MANLKIEGNTLYKQNDLLGAIKCYKSYVTENNEDNKAAYFNMSQCFYYLGQYQEAMDACHQALALDSCYTKALYRLMLSANKLQNHYEQMVAAYSFINLEGETKEKEEAFVMLSQARNALKVPHKCVIDESIRGIVKVLVGKCEKRVQRQYNWEDIQRQIQQNYQNGVNLGYKFIMECEQKEEYRKRLREIIKENHKNESKKDNHNEKDNHQKQQMEAQDSDSDNIFGDSQEKKIQIDQMKNKQIKHIPQQSVQKETLFVNQDKQNIKLEKNDKNQKQNDIQNLVEDNALQKQMISSNPNQNQVSKGKCLVEDKNDINKLYNFYFYFLEESPDKFEQIYKQIKNLIQSDQSVQQKQQLLIIFKKKTQRYKMYLMGQSKRDKLVLKELMKKYNLQNLINDFIIGI